MQTTAPRLVGIDGPLNGKVITVENGEITLGRDGLNTVVIPDAACSRRHCVLTRSGAGDCELTDQNSRNGTFVNGKPIRRRRLAHGDEIRMGKTHFVFVEGEVLGAPSERAIAAGPSLETRIFTELKQAESLYLTPEIALAKASSPSRVAKNLAALLRLINAMRVRRTIEGLSDDLLGILLEVTPASEAIVLVFGAWSSAPERCFRRGEGASEDRAPAGLAEEIVTRVLQDGVALSMRTAAIGEQPVSAVLAAPLAGQDRAIGVLYLRAADPRVEFDEDHLQIITAFGAVVGATYENLREVARLESENLRLREELDIEHDMVGESLAMLDVYRFIAKVAPSDSSVLITGESGTGKELVARAIHRNSPRYRGPLVAVNCAALTESLLESELFGHERGAFTGAVAQKKGKFEIADGGTIFLDEVGELPPPLQAMLLRVLQEREFERVGGLRPIRADVRIIAATNRGLQIEMRNGRFREDLFYRLNVVSCRMPSLRDRRDDVPLLTAYFAEKHGARMGRKVSGLSRESLAVLMSYDWPGNVRELENAIERAIVLGSGEEIRPEDLPEQLVDRGLSTSADTGGYHGAVLAEKRRLILDAIHQAGGNHADAAARLGINPTYLSRLIRNLELRDEIRRSVGR